MPAKVFPLFLSILFVASCGAMNSAQLAGGTVFIPAARVEQCRGTMPCAPGAFSLTALISERPRAQKGVWCARDTEDRLPGPNLGCRG